MPQASQARRPAQRVRQTLLAACDIPGKALPSQAVLARNLDVSPRTVARVVADMVAEGLIDACPGRGMQVADPSAQMVEAETKAAQGPRPSLVTRERVEAWMLEQIRSGTWLAGAPLPSQRSLKQYCGIGFTVLQDVYARLEQSYLIHRRGRRWYVGPHIPPHASAETLRPVWMLAPGRQAHDLPALGGRYVRELGALEAHCQAFGLQLLARDWSALADGPVPHALLMIDTGGDDWDHLRQAWLRLRRRHQGLRLVRLYGNDELRRRQRQYVHLRDGSLWTQMMRHVAEHIVRRQPQRLAIIVDLKRGGQFKASIRLLPELRHRLPHLPISMQVITNQAFASLHELCLHLEQQAHGSRAYFEALLSNYRPTGFADWEEHVRFRQRPDWSVIDSGSFTICDHAARALQARRVQRRQGGYVLSLQDDVELFTAGVAVCAHDASETYRRLAMALDGRYPLELSSRGLLRPGVRLAVRETA